MNLKCGNVGCLTSFLFHLLSARHSTPLFDFLSRRRQRSISAWSNGVNQIMDHGSWLLAEELYERGDPAFVDALRGISAPDRLAAFAEKWFADQRSASRRLLLEYLGRPLNAFRHEPLVKRLFKLAEKAGDDVVMGCFLAALDGSKRRVRKIKHRYDFNTQESWTEETIAVPRSSTLPKDEKAFRYRDANTGQRLAAPSLEKHLRLRLFSLRTRNYLRRRVWRYFRNLGKQQPDRYLTAIVATLCRYSDDDVADGLALIDNWGLMHVLFHHSPVLASCSSGWRLADGRKLSELQPAPAFEPLWLGDAAPLVTLLKNAGCRPVRQWTAQMVRRHHPHALARLPLRQLLDFLSHDDAELSQMAAEALRQSPELNALSVEDWLRLLDEINPQSLDVICELMTQRLDPRAVTLDQAVRLACSRPLPIAQLGFTWLQSRSFDAESECRELLLLAESKANAVRPDMIRWLSGVLGGSPHFQSDWILELLDSRHEDVRCEGWTWFLAEPRAANEVAIWRKLLESPYDDIRLKVVVLLERVGTGSAERSTTRSVSEGERSTERPIPSLMERSPSLTLRVNGANLPQLEPELVRSLWATVLLNIHRGSRTKPRVVAQIATRLQRRPEEAKHLLPILAVALRSVRGPEWRTGLAAVVRLMEQRPELRTVVQREFPELKVGV